MIKYVTAIDRDRGIVTLGDVEPITQDVPVPVGDKGVLLFEIVEIGQMLDIDEEILGFLKEKPASG